MKKCSKCKQVKKYNKFYKNNAKKDGLQTKCKICTKIYEKISYQNNKKEKKAYNELYYKTIKGKEVHKKGDKKYRQKNPEKKKAHNIIVNAISNKKIIKPKICSICEKTDCMIEGHHYDYNKPLEVIWCCSQCHCNIHKNNYLLTIKNKGKYENRI